MTDVRASTPEGGNLASKLGLRDAWLITAAPILGYALAFAYDSGFLGQFGVPSWVIRPDLPHVLSAIAGFSFAAGLIWIVLHSLPSRPWWVLIPPAFTLFGAVVVFRFVVRYTNWTMGWELIFPILFLIMVVLLPLLTILEYVVQPLLVFPEVSSKWERLRLAAMKPKKSPIDGVQTFVLSDASGRRRNWYFVLIGLLFATLLSRSCGSFNAKRIDKLAFRGSPTPCVVVQQYGDQIVCVAIDTTTNTVLKTFSLLSAKETQGAFEVKSFSPLQFPKEERIIMFGRGSFTRPEPKRRM